MREKELRIALVCYGGVSLAVYMHGITKEIWRLAKASQLVHSSTLREAGGPLPDDVYSTLLRTIAGEADTDLRILVDILAGASAGGINAIFLGHAIASGQADRGILLCGSGIGMSIAANKVKGVRAALVHDELTAEMSRSHNDANVVCMSADLLGQKLIEKIVEIWLTTPFQGGRHERRVKKIHAIENGVDPASMA